MPLVITPESEYGKELLKWEQHPSPFTHGQAPGRPYVFREYPKMLYRARKRDDGKVCVFAPLPVRYAFRDDQTFLLALQEAEAWSATCQTTVQNDDEYLKAAGQGWCDGPQEALEAFEKQEQELERAAAEAQYTAQRMSQKAREELEKVDAATFEHVADVTPKTLKRAKEDGGR